MDHSARHWSLSYGEVSPSSPAAAPPRCAARGLTATPRHKGGMEAGERQALAIMRKWQPGES
jgi:hypothetical protein